MEKILRTYVDIEQPISTYKLSPIEKIDVALRTWWKDTMWVKMQRSREQNLENKKRIKEQEVLQNALLEQLYMGFYKDKVKYAVLSIPRDQKDNLLAVLEHRDFTGFVAEILHCDPDLLYVLGDDLPIMVKFRLLEVVK